MYSIKKRFDFSAAHFLRGLPPTHPCAQMHGHNYQVEIEIDTMDLDEIGFVLDYRALDGFKAIIDGRFDHKCINDVVDFNPTAENIARHIWDIVHKGVDATLREKHDSYGLIIYVSETPKTWASYDGAT